MEIEQRLITLKDGRTCTLRNAREQDAQALLEYLKIVSSETSFLASYPEEVNYPMDKEIEVIKRFENDTKSVMILAEVDGKIAGNSSFSPISNRYRFAHRTSLAIALTNEYWGLGIGKALFGMLLEVAKKCQYEQAELEVVSTNERAISLYKQFGFESYGERPNGMKYKDGTYANEMLMVKML